MKFKVYFEIYGKKMCSTVKARNATEVKEQVKNRIEFHRIEEVPEGTIFDDSLEYLKDIMGLK